MVEAAGVGSTLPPIDAPTTLSLRYRNDTRDDTIRLSFGAVTSAFFDALGTPLQTGRRFTERDELGELGGAILSESTARFMFADEDPVGRKPDFSVAAMAITRDTPIIGVVDDMKYQGLDAPSIGAIYVPWQRRPMGLSHLVVRTTGDPTTLVPTLRDLIMQLNPTLPLPEVRTLDDHIAGSIAGRRLQLVPAAAVAALALAVANVGLVRHARSGRHRTPAGTVGSRSRRRLAGSTGPSRVAQQPGGHRPRADLRTGSRRRNRARALESGVRVSPYDPLTFAVVAGVVLVAAPTVSIIPARRVARLDPLIALSNARMRPRPKNDLVRACLA